MYYMKTVILFFICAGLFISCKTTKKQETTIAANNAISRDVFIPEKNGYKLFWEDNFDKNELDAKKWTIRGVGPRRIGYNDASMVKVENGNLLLMYDIRGDSVMGGAVGTDNTFLTKYGYYECRAQLQKSIGPWSAFWMQSPKISQGEDPSVYGAEIDIFEYFKELGKNKLAHCIHWAYGPDMQSTPQMLSELDGLDKGFHTFGLEWTSEKYAFFIDGYKFHECEKGISQIDQYMILSMEIPEKLQGIKMACAPDTFKVDYVRVYKKIE